MKDTKEQTQNNKLANEVLYEHLFRDNPDAMILIEKNIIVDCNQAALDLYGYNCKEDMIGLHPFDLSPEFQDDNEASTLKGKEILRKSLENGSSRFEWRYIKSNGETFIAEVKLIVKEFDDKRIISAVIRDLTDKKIIEQQFKLQRTYFEELFKNFPHAVAMLDNDFKIKRINTGFTDMFQYDFCEIEDKIIFDVIFSDAHHDEVIESTRILSRGYTVQRETMRRCKDGKLKDVLALGYPIISNDQRLGIYVIYMDITSQKEKEKRIEFLAFHDSLTKLYNRKYFVDQLNIKLLEAKRDGTEKIHILFIDLNEFKSINDNLGHLIGDKVLQISADRLSSCIRDSDMVGKFGGDEFIVLLSESDTSQSHSDVINKILKVLEEPYIVEDHTLYLTASIGMSTFPDHGLDSTTLIKNADIAMYEAKEKKGNTLEIYNEKLKEDIEEKFLIESKLRQALLEQELYLNYQPIINTHSGKIIGAEALLRWRQKGGEMIPPSKFIPIAEKNGMIIPIGDWVLREACLQNKEWQNSGFEPLIISVNVSIKQLEQKCFSKVIDNILYETKLDAKYLEIEITETAYMENLERIIDNLRYVSELGVKLSIDDFGTGYSSLGQLKQLDIKKLKIDRSFTKDINADVNNTKIVSAIIAMARSLNINIVAEGVETIEHFNFLKKENCEMVQGYLFGRPVGSNEIIKLFEKNYK